MPELRLSLKDGRKGIMGGSSSQRSWMCVLGGGWREVVSRGQKKGATQGLLSDGFHFLCEAIHTSFNERKERAMVNGEDLEKLLRE